jgi:hypothetical protein
VTARVLEERAGTTDAELTAVDLDDECVLEARRDAISMRAVPSQRRTVSGVYLESS